MDKRTFTLLSAAACLTGTGSVVANDVFQVLVEEQTMTWGADTFGYMQVQDASTWETLCEFPVYTLQDTPSGNRDDTACAVSPGTYNVINHTTRQRIHGLSVGELEGLYTAPEVETIDGSWVYYDPYRVIQADTIYNPLNDVPAPAQLSADVYSSSAAELFWDRADVFGLSYDIFEGDQLTGTTDGTSYFLSDLPAGKNLEFRVIARDSSGRQSAATTVSLQTPGDGSSTDTLLEMPTGLKASVYSSNTLELFWDRQGAGQLFEVYNIDGELLARTDGISYFASELPLQENHRFIVLAVDDDGNASEPASIDVPMDPVPMPADITLDNAEDLLKAAIRIANREPFEEAAEQLAPGVSAVLQYAYAIVTGDDIPDNGLTLVEGTAGGSSDSGFGGLNGGEYLCNAGGSANALSVFGGENSQGYMVSLDECALSTGTYSGTVTSFSGGRSGYSGSSYEDTEFSPVADTLTYLYSGAYNQTYNRYQGTGTDTLTVDLYNEESTDGGTSRQVTDFESVISTQYQQENGSFLDILYADISATINFTADLPALLDNPLTVDIVLNYSQDTAVTDPVGLWNSGTFSITSADGSALSATLEDIDGDATFESIIIVVGDELFTRPVNEGYLVSCRVDSFEACIP